MTEKNNLKQWGSKGEVLVFLHYFGGSALSWQWVTEQLSQDYRCIAVNLPGFGGTPAEEEPSIERFAAYVLEELNSHKIENYTLIGHSMGGKIALQVAANAPEGAVKQVVLVAPSPPTTEPMAQEEKERMLLHPHRPTAEETVEGAVKQTLTEDQQVLAVDTQLIIDEVTWKWWLLEGMAHSIAEKIKPLKIPVTVLASDDDPVITPQVIEQRVMRILKQAKLITTQQVGHLSPLEAPDWVANQIRTIMVAGRAA